MKGKEQKEKKLRDFIDSHIEREKAHKKGISTHHIHAELKRERICGTK